MSKNDAAKIQGTVVPEDDQTAAFVKGLIERGEAVLPPADGKLPPNVTHVIVGKTAAGEPIVQRRRFSLT